MSLFQTTAMSTPLQHYSEAASLNPTRQSGKKWPKEHYETFYRLYITESLPLPEVMRILEKEHGFIVTLKQCKMKVAEMGLKKNLKKAEMEVVVQVLEKKRKTEEEKVATIRFAGVEIHSHRIERILHRKKRAKYKHEKYSARDELNDLELPPKKPSGVHSPETPIAASSFVAPKATEKNAGISAMTEDLPSLLSQLCVLQDTMNVSAEPKSDGTINIQQMVFINKPQRQELDILRHEWEKQRESTWHLLAKGRLKTAEQNARQALAAQLPIDRVQSIATIGSINLLSYIHGCQTNTSAVKTYEWMYNCCKEIYGSEDCATLDSKRNLAWAYQAQNEESEAHRLLAEILKDLINLPKVELPIGIEKHFINISRATTDLAVLLCLQGKITECDELLGALWSAVAFFTLKHKCSLRVARAMGKKLAGLGERDDAAFLLTAIVKSAVTDSGASWNSFLNVAVRGMHNTKAEVGEILGAYERFVLPQLAKLMAILRRMMGFGTAKCEPILRRNRIEIAGQDDEAISERDSEAFENGDKLSKALSC